MQKSLLFSAVSAILFLFVISVSGAPADSRGTSTSDAEREAWKKIKQQTAEFLAHEREFVQSQRVPLSGASYVGQPIAVESAVAAVSSVPVAAAPDSAATTLPPDASSTVAGASSPTDDLTAASATTSVGSTSTTAVPAITTVQAT